MKQCSEERTLKKSVLKEEQRRHSRTNESILSHRSAIFYLKQGVDRHQLHLLLRVTAGHLLLELLLQLLAGADGLLVAGEVGQLLQPGVGEVLRKMLAAPLVGRKELLWTDLESVPWRTAKSCSSRLGQSKPSYHQPVVHADFAETGSDGADVLLVDPRLEQLDGEGCRYS